ncbi:hypothetical protein B9Z55_026957 [Caenorhabditis nigoni]|uniref:F-box domain-containing protein n=1 Tax=Caenorhabditis nigoni TaxID=1611254 RepID=A0A2G5SIT5_9PELO|nr:hypothetical protein B9Z55_026957 [Caenorhabditis nigoni]
MESIPEFLKNNDHYLKSCILYEVAQKKPIFDSYRTFCDTVGQDAMEYRDFEFWYHRFCQGELDFDYDRSADPAPKALMDMPVNLVRKIAENLTSSERCPLRSTNHDIKELSDSLPPFFEEIEIYTSTEKMEWELDDMQFKCKNNYDESCSFSKPMTYEENYIKKSLEYLTPVFKMPNLRVNSLSLENMSPEREHPFIQLEETPDLDGLLPDVPFHVKEVFFSGYETMERIPEFLKSNDHHLKFCILHEVAQEKLLFDSYRTFCDTVGQDAMKYPDFEFWYYRFSQGELDFNYDRSNDPIPKALTDMPVKLVRKIAENLTSSERCPLRSTNHDIKELSDSLPPFFEEIEIYTSTEKMEWQLDDMQFKCKNNYDESCSFSKPMTYEENYIKKSLEYLTPVFKMPNLKVNSLSLINIEDIGLFGERRESTDLDGLLPDVPFDVKNVQFFGYDINRIIHFLSAMKPGHLETIILLGHNSRENFKAIFETDQFKQAKKVYIHSDVLSSVDDLKNFSHLKSFNCGMFAILEPVDVLRILDIVSTFEELGSCIVSFYTETYGHQYIEKFAEAIGGEIPEGPQETYTFSYQRAESNDHLELEVASSIFQCSINICKT